MKFIGTIPQGKSPVTSHVYGNLWVLMEPYSYVFEDFTIDVPAGFSFGASIPRIVWSVIAPSDLPDNTFLLHDFLYRNRGRLPLNCITPRDRKFTRAEADKLFLIMMKEGKVRLTRRWAVYSGVRLAGLAAWKKII